MFPHSSGRSLTRRDVLRLLGAAGAASVVPMGLSACKPGVTPSPLPPDPSVRGLGFVGGTDVEVGQGGWCWFQAPRASFGPNGTLWLGSTVAATGTEDDGAIVATVVDTRSMEVLRRIWLAATKQDDHTSASVLALGSKAQVSWALHKNVDYLELGETSVNGALVTRRISRPGALTPPARGMSYCSVHVVNGQRWLLYRGEQFSWNLLTSPDGVTWTGRGLVVAPAAAGDRPYLHATSDGSRLHIVVTDSNPLEYLGTSVYAGAVAADFSITNAAGTKVGAVGASAPAPNRLTRLLAGQAAAAEADDVDAWLCDLQVVDGRPTGILSLREPWAEGDQPVGGYRHRYFWIRQRPTGWVVEPLAWAGSELFARQPDYAGLAAQDPSDPTRVVVSTNVHPLTAVPLVSAADGAVHFELFEGRRTGEGQWSWTALTANSTEDNIRPTIAAGGVAKTLAWMRGHYWGWTDFDTRIVLRNAVAPA